MPGKLVVRQVRFLPLPFGATTSDGACHASRSVQSNNIQERNHDAKSSTVGIDEKEEDNQEGDEEENPVNYGGE